MDFIFFYHSRLEEYELVAERKECGSVGTYARNLASVFDCARSCKRTASMFLFGTNDFNDSRCNGIYGDGLCSCWCETLAPDHGTCDMITHNGYRLYKFVRPGRQYFENL